MAKDYILGLNSWGSSSAAEQLPGIQEIRSSLPYCKGKEGSFKIVFEIIYKSAMVNT